MNKIVLILMSIIYVIETILFKSFSNKLLLIILVLEAIYIFYKKGLKKEDFKIIVLWEIFAIAFILNRLLFNNLEELPYAVFVLIEIFIFPFSIFILSKESINNKVLCAINIICCLLCILQIFFHQNYFSNSIIILFILLTYKTTLLSSKNIYHFIYTIIILIVGIISNNYILLFFCFLLSLVKIKNIKKHQKICSIILSILLLICSSYIIYKENNTETEEKTYSVVNEYEFPTLKESIASKSINSKIFGSNNILKDKNYMNKASLIYIFYYLGVVGTLIYLISCIYLIFKYCHKSYVNIILILYASLSNILLIPFLSYLLASNILKKDLHEQEEKKESKKKQLLILILLLILGGILFCIIMKQSDNDSNNEFGLELKEKLKATDNVYLELIEINKTKEEEISETAYYYKAKKKSTLLANIIYVDREIDHVHFKYLTIENKNKDTKIKLKISNEDLETIRNFDDDNISRDYSPLVGIDKLKLPIGYFKDKENEYLISRTFKYNILTKQYDEDNKSTIYELIDQSNDLNKNNKEIYLKPNQNADVYLIESEKNLFENEESLLKYIELTNKNSSWYTYKGNNYKLQYSIEPFTKEGYGKNIGKIIEKDTHELSYNDNSLFFKAASKNAIYNLYHYTAQNTKDKGVWFTNYTSTWLSKDYNIKAFYIDTRLNETIGYMLLELYNETKSQKYYTSFLNYADFIVKAWNEESYMIGNNRILPDYFSDNNKIKTHSSLNHQLALINYLFKAFDITKEKEYYNTAKEILNGIIGFKDKWIRDNKDLWYEINSKGEFIGTDYEIVTLDDLLFTQIYLEKFDGKINEELTRYIDSKIEYLKSQKIKIPQSTMSMIEKVY